MMNLIEIQYVTINDVIIPIYDVLIQLLDGIEPMRSQSLYVYIYLDLKINKIGNEYFKLIF